MLAAVLFFSESTIYKQEAKRRLGNPLKLEFDDSSIFNNIRDLQTDKLSNFLYNQMMSTSIQTLLHFEDRNSMAHSIESRVPFLDFDWLNLHLLFLQNIKFIKKKENIFTEKH